MQSSAPFRRQLLFVILFHVPLCYVSRLTCQRQHLSVKTASSASLLSSARARQDAFRPSISLPCVNPVFLSGAHKYNSLSERVHTMPIHEHRMKVFFSECIFLQSLVDRSHLFFFELCWCLSFLFTALGSWHFIPNPEKVTLTEFAQKVNARARLCMCVHTQTHRDACAHVSSIITQHKKLQTTTRQNRPKKLPIPRNKQNTRGPTRLA